MSIQSNINQGLSLMSLLASQSPMAAAHREAVAEAQKAEEIQRQADKDVETYERMAEHGVEPEDEAEAAVQLQIAEKGASAYQKQFELNPNTHNYGRYQASLRDVGELQGRLSKFQKQQQMKDSAADAGMAETQRLAESRNLTNMLDLSKLDERTIDRVNRAYKKAEHDTYYLQKNKGGNQ